MVCVCVRDTDGDISIDLKFPLLFTYVQTHEMPPAVDLHMYYRSPSNLIAGMITYLSTHEDTHMHLYHTYDLKITPLSQPFHTIKQTLQAQDCCNDTIKRRD